MIVPSNPTYLLVSYRRISQDFLSVDAYIAVVRSLFGDFSKHNVVDWILLRICRLCFIFALVLYIKIHVENEDGVR
jgi:hypothetical protein